MNVNQRSGGLDFIKVLATIGIFFHHYQQVFNVTFTNHINFFHGLIYWGYLVELFFIISGFVTFQLYSTAKFPLIHGLLPASGAFFQCLPSVLSPMKFFI